MRGDDSILPVSALLTGQYDLEEICLGMPSIVGRDGVKRTFEIPLDEYEAEKLRQSAKAVHAVLAQLELDNLNVL